MKDQPRQNDEPDPRVRKLPKFGQIRGEDCNPVVIAYFYNTVASAFGREDLLEPIPDGVNVPVMDVIQGNRWFAQVWIEWIESWDLPEAEARRMADGMLGTFYRIEQDCLKRLGLETD